MISDVRSEPDISSLNILHVVNMMRLDNETLSGTNSMWQPHSSGMISDARSESDFLSSNMNLIRIGNETSSSSGNASIATRHLPKEMSIIAGYYMVVICVLGIIENLLVLNTFRRHPQLKFVSSEFIKILCLYDICMGFCAFPFIVVSCMANEWIFSDVGCKWYGFAMTTIGSGSISSLTCIALERYVIITSMKHGAVNGMSSLRARKVGVLCLFIAVMLALLPFFGVGSYDHEPVFLSCAPAWWSTRAADRVFIVVIFTCVFVVPVCLVTFSYAGICVKVFATKMGQRRKKNYIKLTVMSFLMIACFLLSWGPYAVFAFLQTAVHNYSLTAMENMVPVMMAKSCILWNPIIYVGVNSKFRALLKTDVREMFAALLTTCSRKGDNSNNKKPRENNNESKCIDQTPNRNDEDSGNHSGTSMGSGKKSPESAMVTHVEKPSLTAYVNETSSQSSSDLGTNTVVWTRVDPKNVLKTQTDKFELERYTFMQIETCI